MILIYFILRCTNIRMCKVQRWYQNPKAWLFFLLSALSEESEQNLDALLVLPSNRTASDRKIPSGNVLVDLTFDLQSLPLPMQSTHRQTNWCLNFIKLSKRTSLATVWPTTVWTTEHWYRRAKLNHYKTWLTQHSIM